MSISSAFPGTGATRKPALYAQVTRSGVQTPDLNAESQLTGSAGMLVRMDGIDALHAELSAKAGPFALSPITFTPRDARVMLHLIDPFGDAISVLGEQSASGIARPLEQAAAS